MASRSGEVIILLSTVGYCGSPVSFEVPQMERKMFKKNGERMQQRTAKVIGAMGPISYEKRLRDLGWFSLAKKRG